MNNQNTIDDLISLKSEFLKKIEHIDATIAMLNGDIFAIAHHGSKKKAPFDAKDSYKEKIAKVLKDENRFLNITQLIDIIHSYNPKQSRDDVKNSVNSAKSLLLKENAIIKVVAGSSNQNSFYGSPNWLTSENKPQPEHMYDESLIKEKKLIEI
jgi:hypothetical protein